MTTVLPDLNSVPVEVTYDSLALNVGMRVNKLVLGVWQQVGVVALAPRVAGGGPTYGTLFTPLAFGENYIVELAVYTDGTFTTYHPDYSVSSRAFVASATLGFLLSQIASLVIGNIDIVAQFDPQTVTVAID